MLSGRKRVAYTRIPAQHVIYSQVDYERGRDAGVLQTVFLRVIYFSLKGNSGQNFFFKKLHSSYRALKCQKNPFCFILITFFVQKLLKF